MNYITFFATIWFLHLAALLSPGANTLLLFQIGANSDSLSQSPPGSLGINDRSRSFGGSQRSPRALHGVLCILCEQYPLAQAALRTLREVRIGLFAVCGITLAESIWVSLAALGISAVFETFPGVHVFIGIAGGLYLIYLGLKLWAASRGPAGEIRKWQLTPAAAFRLGFLTNITNPKTMTFFGSVYAASFTPELPVVAKYTAVALAIITAFLWHAMLVFLFSRHLLQRSYTNARSAIDRVSGSVFVIIGCVLIVAGGNGL